MDLVGIANGEEASNQAQAGDPLELAPDGPTGELTDRMPLWLDVADMQPARP